jgi:hypothetical protein
VERTELSPPNFDAAGGFVVLKERVSMKTITAALVFTLAACAASTTPDIPAATLLITNATCNPGPCSSLIIGGFTSIPMLAPSSGQLHLGLVKSASGCLAFPPSASVGGATWTVADSIALVATDLLTLAAVGQTNNFVPQAAPGWSVPFRGTGSGGSVPISAVVSAHPCTP